MLRIVVILVVVLLSTAASDTVASSNSWTLDTIEKVTDLRAYVELTRAAVNTMIPGSICIRCTVDGSVSRFPLDDITTQFDFVYEFLQSPFGTTGSDMVT